MKNVLPLSAIFLLAIVYNACSPKLMPEGRYQDEAPIVDGKIDDWGLPLRFSNPEYNMQYAVTNDDKNIYVCVYSKDQSFQLRMLKAGMSICFDPKGEKDKKMSLVFPVMKPDEQAENRNGNPIRNTDMKTVEEQLLLQSDYYNTIGLVDFENGQFAIADRKNNIKLAIRLHEDSSLVYEAAIPIKYILGTDLTPGYVAKNFSVGIVINASHHTVNPNNGYRPHSSHGGGMGGMHGMGGGRNYGSGNSQPSKPEENWYQFRLVYKKA
jgi:hypothetical protein